MCDLICCRARVGLFNLTHRKSTKGKKLFKSDIKSVLSYIKTIYLLQFFINQNTTQTSTTLVETVHPVASSFIHLILTKVIKNSGLDYFIHLLFFFNFFLSILLLSGDIHPNPGPMQNYSICHINART